jgi:hypothetical protein
MQEDILPAVHNKVWCENVLGNNIIQWKDLVFCSNCSWLENAKYSDWITNGMHYVWDHSSFWENAKYCIECEWTWRNASNIYYSKHVFMDASNIFYSFQCCQNVHNLFWCVWVRNKSYCIFNKQYTKEEYEAEVSRIIDHMQKTWERWEFFHPSISSFGYNETVAFEQYPLEKNSAFALWYTWQENESDISIPNDVIVVEKHNYPDTTWSALLDAPNLMSYIFICEISWRPFRLQKAEIDFYKKHNILLPSKHPDVRHAERNKNEYHLTLYLRDSDLSWKEILSVYPPWNSQKVYSLEEYVQYKYW